MPKHSFRQFPIGLERSCRLFHTPFTPFCALTLCVADANDYCQESIHRSILPCKHSVFSKAADWNAGRGDKTQLATPKHPEITLTPFSCLLLIEALTFRTV
jgi:hypothetical protein